MSGPDLMLTASALQANGGLWTHLRQWPILLGLVRELERRYAPHRSTNDPARVRGRLAVYALGTAAQLLSLVRVQRSLDYFNTAGVVPGGGMAAGRLARQHFRQAGGPALLDSASRSAADARPDDETARYVRQLCLGELAGGTAPPAGFVEPKRMRFAYGWLEAGEAAAATSQPDAAMRCFHAAVGVDPGFNRARGRYARLLRQRNPMAASKHFGVMLDHWPKLAYGRFTLATVMADQVVGHVYRDFAISFRQEFDAFVAQPLFQGIVPVRSVRPLMRRYRRTLGLMMMRVHLERRMTRRLADKQAEHAVAPFVRLSPLKPKVKPRFVISRERIRQRIHQFVTSRTLARFILVADSEAGLQAQIDEIYRVWLMPGAAAEPLDGTERLDADAAPA